jgi:hypothetical protein
MVIRGEGRVSNKPPLLASAALVGVVTGGAIAGIALQHHTPGQPSSAPPAPPTVSYPGSAVFDNLPAMPDPPAVTYPGSAVFDNQPAASWWRHHHQLKR